MSDFITIKEAAEILGVSEVTIRNFLLKNKFFKAKRFGRQIRIEKKSFYEYMENSEIR